MKLHGQTLSSRDLIDLQTSLEQLNFSFDRVSPTVVRGFSEQAIIELSAERNAAVSMLISTGALGRWRGTSAACVTAVSQAFDIDLAQWLGEAFARRTFDAPWTASRDIRGATVTAEYICADAVLVSVSRERYA